VGVGVVHVTHMCVLFSFNRVSLHYETMHYILHTAHHIQGVRDFLVHKLYEFPIEEIDSILPQLVHLFVVWPADMSHALCEYLTKLCTRYVCVCVCVYVCVCVWLI
jgi:hypothetical protein